MTHVRLATTADLDDIARLWHESALHMDGGSSDLPSRADLRDRIDAELRHGWLLFVTHNGEGPIGMLAIKPSEKVLDQLFVSPEEQCRGIGRQLLNKAKSQMPKGFVLRTAASNKRAAYFYQAQGLRLASTGTHPRHGHAVHFYEWAQGVG